MARSIMLGRLDWNRDTAAQLEAVSEVWRVLERSMNSSVGSKSDTVERLAKSGKKRVSYSSLGVTMHSTHWVSIILLSAIVGRLEEVPSQEGSILPCGRK